MRHVPLCLASGLLSAALAVPAVTLAQTNASASVAHVYVQAKSGVYVFDANAAGQLSQVSGSPFADTGQMEAVRGNDLLISVGTNYLHSYAVMPNGAVGRQLAQTNTADYGGNECGNTDQAGSVLDHTGQYFSVQLYGALTSDKNNYLCDAWQTYKLAANGQFTFLGDWVNNGQDLPFVYENSPVALDLMTVSSNDKYTCGVLGDPDGDYFIPFTRASAGDITLDNSFTEIDPAPDPDSPNGRYTPVAVAADPANHLAVIVSAGYHNQLASYSVDNTNGSIKSTNTYQNMPAVDVGNSMAISPAGNLVAVGSVGSTVGIDLYHFNGAAPPTSYILIPNVEADQMAWDKSNHLYAVDYTNHKLSVYTVTPTSVKQVSGSPYSVPEAQNGAWGRTGFVVVPQS